MTRTGSRWAESGRRTSATGFLAGFLAGAVLAGAVIVLLLSESVIVRAAAMIPLTGALVLAGAMAAGALRGNPPEAAKPAEAPPESDEGADGERARREPEERRKPEESEPDRTSAASEEKQHRPPARTDTEAVAEPEPNRAGETERGKSGGETERGASGEEPVAPEDEPGKDPDSEPAPEDATQQEPPAEDIAPPAPPPSETAPPAPPPHHTLGLDAHASVIEAWRRYRRDGDGFFTAQGLRRQLEGLGFRPSVREGSAVNAHGDVLVVEADEPDTGRFFVVPSFMKSPGAAPEWFEDASDGALSARTRRIHRLAEGTWTDTSFAVVEKGVIE